MKQTFIFIISLLFASFSWSQTGTLVNRVRENISPSEERFNAIQFDTESKVQRELYANPAFYELLNQKKDSLWKEQARYKSVLMSGYANGELKGDFLPQEGNKFSDFRLLGAGEYSLAKAGTLFGRVQYVNGSDKNIGWNATRHPEIYAPYISTDSLGGDYRFEDYSIHGGYSFSIKDLFFGLSGQFRGEQAYRRTDPRAVNNTTWLNVKAGVGQVINNHLWMFDMGYESNKQKMQLRYWRPGQQDRFFVGYGFGLYDVKHSTVSFGYSRMLYMSGFNASLTYKSPEKKALSALAKIAYKYNHMKTEEASIRDLYSSDTYNIEPKINIHWQVDKQFSLALFLESSINARKGYENIFEQYKVSNVDNTYDFRQIDTQQNYERTMSSTSGQIKATYQINNHHRLEALGGALLFICEEKYKNEYKMENRAVEPHIGIGYTFFHKQSEIQLNGIYIKKILLDNEYDVDIRNSSIQYLDFQHAFTPYAYYNSTYSSVNVNATYTYHLGKSAVGFDLRLMYKTGNRDEDTVYSKKIGFDSSAPRISQNPDKHDEVWGSASVFYLF